MLIRNNKKFLEEVKEYLNGQFSMKGIGEAAYILGIKIYRDRPNRLLALSQSTYIDKILKRFSMDNSKRGLLPVIKGIKLSVTQCPATTKEKEDMSKKPYASAIGSLMYAMLCTRLALALAISMTNRYQSNPGMTNWTTIKNILKYLRRMKVTLTQAAV